VQRQLEYMLKENLLEGEAFEKVIIIIIIIIIIITITIKGVFRFTRGKF
jgi:hypothetical protein